MPGWGRWDRWARAGQWGDGDGGGVELTWLLYDEFTTAESAPLASPRTCEPGPGTLTILDTGNNADIVSGSFKCSGLAGTGDPRFSHNSNAGRYAGLSGYFETSVPSTARLYVALHDSDAGAPRNCSVYQVGNRYYVYENGSNTAYITGVPVSSFVKRILILRASGVFFIADGEMVWVGTSANGANDDWPICSGVTNATNVEVSTVGLLSMPDNGHGEWSSEFGAATSATATPSSGATATIDADSWNEFSWTVGGGETLEWMIRRIDDTHTWVVRCDQAGGTIKLIEINGGETERSSTAQAWTPASTYRIVVIANDENISTFVSGTAAAKNSYASASYNKTATGAKISGFASGADLVYWPIDVSSMLPAELV